MVATCEMTRRYGWKLIDGRKDSGDGCNLRAARLASLTSYHSWVKRSVACHFQQGREEICMYKVIVDNDVYKPSGIYRIEHG